MNTITIHPEASQALAEPVKGPDGSPAGLLATIAKAASNPDIDMAKVTALMDLYERVTARQARQAFDLAISAAKAEIPVVEANRTGHNSKRYADMAAFARAVDPVLGKHGLSYRFRTVQADRIQVTCILSHREGHSEETTLSGPPDATGSKNAIQAIGSTLTYLQRYSLKQALGLAAADDDDGAKAETGVITDAQRDELGALIEATGTDIAQFCGFMRVEALADIPAGQFGRAKAALEAKQRRAGRASA